MKKKKAPIEVYGKVINTFSNATFKIRLENGHILLGHLSGKLRQNRIYITLHDRVTVEVSHHDLTKGRIIFRQK